MKRARMAVVIHLATALAACAHGWHRPDGARKPASVDPTRAWSEYGDCVIWPINYPILGPTAEGIEVFPARDRVSGKDVLTTNPEACRSHRAKDGKTRRFMTASVDPVGRLTPEEAAGTGCLVYGGPIVSTTKMRNLEPVKRYGDPVNEKFSFLAFPSPTCNALFKAEPDVAGYVNP